MIKTSSFSMFGVEYKTTQFTAIPALEILAKQSTVTPMEMLAGTASRTVYGEWRDLRSREAINECVRDEAGALPARLVLNGLLSLVNEFNFSFMFEWKGVKVPRRLIDPSQNVSTTNVDPLVSQLVQAGKASIRELEEYYSLEDAFKMFDIITAAGVNAGLANEAAVAKSRRG